MRWAPLGRQCLLRESGAAVQSGQRRSCLAVGRSRGGGPSGMRGGNGDRVYVHIDEQRNGIAPFLDAAHLVELDG